MPRLSAVGISGLQAGEDVKPRDTRTGAVLERMVLPALDCGGYAVRTQVNIGVRPGGGAHRIDVLAEKNDNRFLVSLKWQQTSGTAEQKVPFEIMCLAQAVFDQAGIRAYLVLGGPGWRLRDFYLGGGLLPFLREDVANAVRIVSLESFVASANQGTL